MRFAVLLATCLHAQAPDPAFEPLSRAYDALKKRDYALSIASFQTGIELAPQRAAVRKDLAYVYLKIGETELARDQFREAMRLDPSDLHVAKEYAFLCYETRQRAQARRIFDRLRKSGDTVATEAFENIDRPLREGIERWSKAIAMGADNFSAHFELATLAEQRDELELAASHYRKAWRMLPDRRSVLVDLGRTLKSLNRTDEADAALLAASRGGEPRAAELARELLPERYPFVPEFRRALELDPGNIELRRELGYLLLRMNNQAEAEAEFKAIVSQDASDLLSATQLGFLLNGRGDRAGAAPLFERVMAGKDEELANRVRAVLRLPQVLRARPEPQPASLDAKLMAERSSKAGYMKDALKYLQVAHEADPVDFDVMLKLGWTYNVLRQDRQAVRWFDLARRSPDPLIAAEARDAYRNLRGSNARFRASAWLYPMFSSRWRDVFSYGQASVELQAHLPFRPYASIRFVGDTRSRSGGVSPQSFSESSFIAAAGVSSRAWRGATAWFEAGSAMSYLKGGMLPDYRGGISFLRGFGPSLTGEENGWFLETGADGVFVSRFGDDFLVYSQNRGGYAAGSGSFRAQFHWNANLTVDSKRQAWANLSETGPGIRISSSLMPQGAFLTVNLLRGWRLVSHGAQGSSHYNDLRAGFWYAFRY